MAAILSEIAQRLNNNLHIQIQSEGTSVKLMSLPLELLLEILKLLVWKDVLRVRRICKYLAEVTRTRDIWLNLVHEHVLANELPPRLERPIEMHSSPELEHLLLLWKSADCRLESNLHPARERIIAAAVKVGDFKRTNLVHLIKGGRWLLVTEQTAAVTYYDLDAPTTSGVQLIADQMALNSLSEVLMDIDYDMHSPFLAFTIAFSLRAGHRDTPQYRQTVEIWRVGVVLDATQHVVGLAAACIASFPHHLEIEWPKALSLLGSNIAFHAAYTHSRTYSHTDPERYIFVVDWTQANENPLQYPWRVVHEEPGGPKIYLLPGGNLFVASNTWYSLIDCSSVPETSCFQDPSQYSFPVIWNIHGPPTMGTTRFVLTETRASFIVYCIAWVYNLTFDCRSVGDAPHLRCGHPLFSVGHVEDTPFIGYKHIILIDRLGEASVFGYPGPFATCEEPTIAYRKFPLSRQLGAHAPLMDEESGQFVYCINQTIQERAAGTKFGVVDFAIDL